MSDETATIDRDLAAIEAALASGRADHDLPQPRRLQELALTLQAEAPEPEPAFAEQMRSRVEKGFERPAAVRRAARQQSPLAKLARDFAPLGGLAAAILLIGALAISFEGGSGGGANSDDGGGGSEALSEGAGSGGGGAGEGAMQNALPLEQSDRAVGRDGASVAPAVPLPRQQGFVPREPNRKIERSFSLELDVPRNELTRVADEVTAVTNRHGGFVLNSSVSSGEDSGGGDFSLRIPTAQLRPALRDLAELAPVIEQSQQGRDVTRAHVTAKDRLQAARAERRSLLRRLEEAATDEEAEAIRRQLDLVAAEINGLRAQLRDLRLRTEYAVVNVSLVAGDGDQGGGASGSFDDAVGDAGDLLVGLAGVLIRVLALAIPLGLIALAAWLAARAARRRRRESALA
jgi:Domain of unknown function (DUF4349)